MDGPPPHVPPHGRPLGLMVPCKFMLKFGNCKDGDSCSLGHPNLANLNPNDQSRMDSLRKARRQQEARQGVQDTQAEENPGEDHGFGPSLQSPPLQLTEEEMQVDTSTAKIGQELHAAEVKIESHQRMHEAVRRAVLGNANKATPAEVRGNNV